MTVAEYLERARQAAQLAEQMPSERARLLEIAQAWLLLAEEAAKEAANEAVKNATDPKDKLPE